MKRVLPTRRFGGLWSWASCLWRDDLQGPIRRAGFSSRLGLGMAAGLVLALCLARPAAVVAGQIVLYDPNCPRFYASGLDQPELTAIMYDGTSVITDGSGTPLTFDVFVDTGSSGSVISHLTAVGYSYEDLFLGTVNVPGLGLTGAPGQFIGTYTDWGIGGPETGNVTRAYGLAVRNGAPLMPDLLTGEMVVDTNEFINRGQHDLWVRQVEGYGERANVEGLEFVDPMNIVGMPVIKDSIMVMDPTPLVDGDRLQTFLVAPGSPLPQTNVTFKLALKDFVGTAPPGEVLPTNYKNPIFEHVTLSQTANGNTVTDANNVWLFDTGSSSTFVSFNKARQLGLIDPVLYDANSYDRFVQDQMNGGGLVEPVGGIGTTDANSVVNAPVLTLDEISIRDEQGDDIVWRNVDVLILDLKDATGQPAFDGVFGTNLWLPAVTIDPNDVLGSLDNISSGFFDAIVFDATDENNVQLRLDLVPEPAALALLGLGALALLRRKN